MRCPQRVRASVAASDSGRGLVEVEVALADEDPGGDELEAVGDVVVVVEELADVGVGCEAGGLVR